MRTALIYRTSLDEARLREDLEQAERMALKKPYEEFSTAKPWAGLMLWTPGGRGESGILADYDFELPSEPTAEGRLLPYLSELIEQNFAVGQLLFARLAVMRENALLPHRDHLELQRAVGRSPAYRLHLPLVTHEEAFFLEEGTVFQMRQGEVWSLDVGRLHSAAVFGRSPRIHLLLDFAGTGPLESALRFEPAGTAVIPSSHVVTRRVPRPTELDGLIGLATVVDQDNIEETIAIVTKKMFRLHVGADFVWTSLRSIAEASADEVLVRHVADLEAHCTLATSPESRA